MADREELLGGVLAEVVALSRSITAEQRTPFEGVALTASQLSVLFLLAHSRRVVTPGEVASTLGITRGAVTQVVDGLRAAGLVESVPHPHDRRSRILQLTEAERTRVADFERGVVRRLMPSFKDLSDGELTHLAELLSRVGARP
ncbi:MarR family transcriptional regulator [Nostocoides sp. F2B08]|uniref:MarR family winged helix-turn-helix transcriptional regulator n=1 Tax=Nostocoides sp. F2B08 TaxID=2653936 RepID=UPI001263CE57|nr:MarR family transcriptional regulator [Tetrasphaera sp. F2B08]KAB7743874.1 MarR family transcriptional regulator [Tetrasphaera sp. F2B08]